MDRPELVILEARIGDDVFRYEVSAENLPIFIDIRTIVKPGDKFYGFCNGFFGRDSYGLKVVEAVGKDWIVVREDDDVPNMAIVNVTRFDMLIDIQKWKSNAENL